MCIRDSTLTAVENTLPGHASAVCKQKVQIQLLKTLRIINYIEAKKVFARQTMAKLVIHRLQATKSTPRVITITVVQEIMPTVTQFERYFENCTQRHNPENTLLSYLV